MGNLNYRQVTLSRFLFFAITNHSHRELDLQVPMGLPNIIAVVALHSNPTFFQSLVSFDHLFSPDLNTLKS